MPKMSTSQVSTICVCFYWSVGIFSYYLCCQMELDKDDITFLSFHDLGCIEYTCLENSWI